MFILELQKFINHTQSLRPYKISNTIGHYYTYGISGSVLSLYNERCDEIRILIKDNRIRIYRVFYDMVDKNRKLTEIINAGIDDIFDIEDDIIFVLCHGKISYLDELLTENLKSINYRLDGCYC